MPDAVVIHWTNPAANDLEEIAKFIAKDNPVAALSVAATLYNAANSLDIFPQRGREGRIAGTRELILPGLPYIVVYRVRKESVQVLRIRHTARNWPERG